ncbi:MAG TPA: OPT/YSL family transporter, partial [Steroidobacteraceae bacterium]|nr:OPT/YSL family transporter [Steroidobacteraceae bacterium]
LMASVSKGLFGGSLPWSMVGVGALIGIATIILDETLKKRGASFRVPVLAAAVGIYLPLDLTVPIGLGGILAWFCERTVAAGAVHGVAPAPEEVERLNRRGMLFAAGVITGEALMGILIAIPIVSAGRADAIALPAALRIGETPFGEWLGLAVLALLAWWLYRTATVRGHTPPAAPAPT